MERVLANDFAELWRMIASDATAAFQRVGARGWFVLGEEVERFEAALAALWGVHQVIGCANGLDAIEIGLRCLGIERGDRVLTTPLSAFATTLAIVRAGGVPVFVDVDATGCLDLDQADAYLRANPGVRYMVPVHLYGHAIDLDRLARLKAAYELNIVEDCAQSILATSRGRQTGTVGQLAATSFYPTKNLGALGDGGAVIASTPELARRARCLRDYGQSAKYQHSDLGLNSRLDEVHAAILHDALLPRLAEFTAERRRIARRYASELANPRLRLPPGPDGSDGASHLFPVLVDDPTALIEHLRTHEIQSARHYPSLIPAQGALVGTDMVIAGPLPTASDFAAHEVSLPIHPFLTDAAIDRVIATCRSFG